MTLFMDRDHQSWRPLLILSNSSSVSCIWRCSAANLRCNRSTWSPSLAKDWYGDVKCLENAFRASTPVTYQCVLVNLSLQTSRK